MGGPFSLPVPNDARAFLPMLLSNGECQYPADEMAALLREGVRVVSHADLLTDEEARSIASLVAGAVDGRVYVDYVRGLPGDKNGFDGIFTSLVPESLKWSAQKFGEVTHVLHQLLESLRLAGENCGPVAVPHAQRGEDGGAVLQSSANPLEDFFTSFSALQERLRTSLPFISDQTHRAALERMLMDVTAFFDKLKTTELHLFPRDILGRFQRFYVELVELEKYLGEASRSGRPVNVARHMTALKNAHGPLRIALSTTMIRVADVRARMAEIASAAMQAGHVAHKEQAWQASGAGGLHGVARRNIPAGLPHGRVVLAIIGGAVILAGVSIAVWKWLKRD